MIAESAYGRLQHRPQGSGVIVTGRPSRLALVDGTGSVVEAGGGCSETHARLVGWRARHRGWLSSAEVRATTVPDAGVSHGQHWCPAVE